MGTITDSRENLIVRIDVMREALQWCAEYFTARDEMNAKIHCAPIRLSPITERVRQALNFEPTPDPDEKGEK